MPDGYRHDVLKKYKTLSLTLFLLRLNKHALKTIKYSAVIIIKTIDIEELKVMINRLIEKIINLLSMENLQFLIQKFKTLR